MIKNQKKVLWMVFSFVVMLVQGNLMAEDIGEVEHVKAITTTVINESTKYSVELSTGTLGNSDEVYYPVGKVWVRPRTTVSKMDAVNGPRGKARLVYTDERPAGLSGRGRVAVDRGEYEFELPDPIRFEEYSEFEAGPLFVQIRAKQVILEEGTEEGMLMSYAANYTVIIRDKTEKNYFLPMEGGPETSEVWYL